MQDYNQWSNELRESVLPEIECTQERIRERYSGVRDDIKDYEGFVLPRKHPETGDFLEMAPQEAVISLLSEEWGDTAVFEERVDVIDGGQRYNAWLDIYYHPDEASLTGSFCLYLASLPGNEPISSQRAGKIEQQMDSILAENGIELVEFNNGV